MIEDVGDHDPAAASQKNGNRLEVDCRRRPRRDARRPDQGAPGPVQPALATPASSPSGGTITPGGRARSGPTARLDHLPRDRHRHRHDAGAAGQAVPGLLPGRRLDDAQVRRHRPGPGDHPPLLPDDGRRHHGRRASRARARRSPSGCRREVEPPPAGVVPDGEPPADGRRRPRAARSWSSTTTRPSATCCSASSARKASAWSTAAGGDEGLAPGPASSAPTSSRSTS